MGLQPDSDRGHPTEHDPRYAEKAKTVSNLSKDICEVLVNEDLSSLAKPKQTTKVAFHSPCTLQHGQQLNGMVEKILINAGYELTNVVDSHLCCGSAGTYSILQNELSQLLLDNKLHSLQAESPSLIATANIGCQLHMATKADVPVKHWIELLDN